MKKFLSILAVAMLSNVYAEPANKPYTPPKTHSFHIFNTIVDENKNIELNSLNELVIPTHHYAGGVVLQANAFDFTDDYYIKVNFGIEVNRLGCSFRPMVGIDNYNTLSGKFEVTRYQTW